QDQLITDTIHALAHFPEKGRVGRRSGTRELVIGGTPFIAIYQIRPRLDRVEILFLVHHAEKWPKRRRRT
ncbi:MAG: type II toxin-antitoxin system RelE/ParE family toxin, partial [Asticcacaulis sp.]|nr:type II toxin-antitoxin system RelE/ParE family toxin [Asticcacaulis sp.]